MGNVIGMLSGGYFGVISPEGAASILGHYKDDAHKATQFPLDCKELATSQCIYGNQLKEVGVVDELIWEVPEGEGQKETFQSFPVLKSRIQAFMLRTLSELSAMTASNANASNSNANDGNAAQLAWLDIVDPGNTLRATGLEALETIAEVSARLIVNKAAMKLRSEALKALVARFAAVMDRAP